MRIPKQFQMAGAIWKVEQIHDLADLGQTLRDSRTVKLKKDVPKEVKEQTFCHELMHVIKFMQGKSLPEEHNEQDIDLMGTFLHHFLISAKY
jgi:predicted  nucleic acid-binding Zn ribbon protein